MKNESKFSRGSLITLVLAIAIFALLLVVYLYPNEFFRSLRIDPRQAFVDAEFCITACEKADVHKAFSIGVLAGGVGNVNISIVNILLPVIAVLFYLLLPNRTRSLDVVFALALIALWAVFDAPHFQPTDIFEALAKG